MSKFNQQLDIPLLKRKYPSFYFNHDKFTSKPILDKTDLVIATHSRTSILWFTPYKEKNVQLIIPLINDSIDYTNARIYGIEEPPDWLNMPSNWYLCFGQHGSIFTGHSTYIHMNKGGKVAYILEDIYYYKSNFVANKPYLEKLELMYHILQEYNYSNNLVQLYMPLMAATYTELIEKINHTSIPYTINCIKYKYFRNTTSIKLIFSPTAKAENIYNALDKQPVPDWKIGGYNKGKNKDYRESKDHKEKNTDYREKNTDHKEKNTDHKEKSKDYKEKEWIKIFSVIAEPESDKYIIQGNNNYILHIPDFETSVMMNTLFRSTKPINPHNLDYIEESEDEEESMVTKELMMECKYNYSMKAWQPLRSVES